MPTNKLFLTLACTLALAGCGTTAPAADSTTAAPPTSASQAAAPTDAPAVTVVQSFSITIEGITDGQPIPEQFSCNGANESPLVRWSNLPPEAKSLMLTVIDLDADQYGHWGVYNIPPTMTELPANLPKKKRLDGGMMQAKTGNGSTNYEGPCPPAGKPHRYVFTLYALSEPPTFAENLEKFGVPVLGLVEAAKDKTIATAQLTGTYQKK